MDEVVLLFVVLVLLISIPSLIQCKSKKKESSRKVDRGKAKVDARSRGVSRVRLKIMTYKKQPLTFRRSHLKQQQKEIKFQLRNV